MAVISRHLKKLALEAITMFREVVINLPVFLATSLTHKVFEKRKRSDDVHVTAAKS